MDTHPPHLSSIPGTPATGAAMDTVVPRDRRGLYLRIAIAAALLLAAGLAFRYFMPTGLAVQAQDVRIARVEKGVFLDDIVVRAVAEPLRSVILDSTESGRVEEVVARDGAMVKKGELLFRLSNPQRNLELLARQADHAQQIANLANLRVAQETSRTDHQRRLSDIAFALSQAEKKHARNAKLAAQGFISASALEESADALAQQRHALAQEQQSVALELKVQRQALDQMEQAIAGLQSGLKLVTATVEALAVRAPADGKLTGFRLQVGETVKTDQHIGRIDDPSHFKLAAQVDEFYLGRMAVGRRGTVQQDGKTHAVEVATLYPQIREGRFTVDLVFVDGQPAVLNPGQSLDARITLGDPAPALLLPNGAFVNDTGGTWVFAVGSDGTATKRPVRIGRRSNAQVEVLSGLAPGDQVIVSGYTAFGKAERLQLSK